LKYHIFSDIHAEYPSNRYDFLATFDHYYSEGQGADDTCILAGDIGNLARPHGTDLHNLLVYIGRHFKTTLYVPGNHEFWGSSIRAGQMVLDDWRIPNVTILSPWRRMEGLDGRPIVGATMWFPHGWDPQTELWHPDFERIADCRWEAPDQFSLFEDVVARHIEKGSVVITHHSPHRDSIPQMFQNDDNNWFFNVDMSRYIYEKQPALWVHGHTHSPFDYTVDQTRVYCNPSGYANEDANPQFWRRVEIELP